jgi:hypothetical protein
MRKPDLWATVRDLARWHVTTQVGARRNALVACTELAQRSRERDDVELFLSRVSPAGTALPPNRVLPDAEVTPTTELAR